MYMYFEMTPKKNETVDFLQTLQINSSLCKEHMVKKKECCYCSFSTKTQIGLLKCIPILDTILVHILVFINYTIMPILTIRETFGKLMF